MSSALALLAREAFASAAAFAIRQAAIEGIAEITEDVLTAVVGAISGDLEQSDHALSKLERGRYGGRTVKFNLLPKGTTFETLVYGSRWDEVFEEFGPPRKGETPEEYAARITRVRRGAPPPPWKDVQHPPWPLR